MIKLSILIPSIPSRMARLWNLLETLEKQIAGRKSVEILALTDNKQMSIGSKRDKLKDLAAGEYLCFLDDDDAISDDYVDQLLAATNSQADVIPFNQIAVINGIPVDVDFDLSHANEELQWDKEGESYKPLKRQPFHVCAWRSEIAKQCTFPDISYGEDAVFVEQACRLATTQHKINQVLHRYIFDDQVTEASTESNEHWKNPNT